MPNWCQNTLNISGEAEEIKKFKEAAKNDKTALSLDKTYPMPKELFGTQSPTSIVSEKEYEIAVEREKNAPDNVPTPGLPITSKMSAKFKKLYGADNWYDWKIQHWGTKWDVEAELVEEGDDGYLEYQFDSAWSPPVTWLEHVSQEYPTLRFLLKYEEDGCAFMGRAKAIGGVVDDDCLDC